MKKTGFKRLVCVIIATIFALQGTLCFASETTSFKYLHDPRLNSKAMEDIVVDPNAVYGFSPDPDSVRLGEYASYDWSDPAVVENAKKNRIKYLGDFTVMFKLWKDMEAEGKSVEEIARAVSAKRNELRLEANADDPEKLAKVKKSNLETYGNENGPQIDYLLAKYGDWETILIKSFSSNSGMDACTGLYDAQYNYNVNLKSVSENSVITYTVKKGDCLAKIAKKYYGTDKQWETIYKANKDSIGKDYVILVGQQLIIP